MKLLLVLTLLAVTTSFAQKQSKKEQKEQKAEMDSAAVQAHLDSVCARSGHQVEEWVITGKSPIEQVNRSADSVWVELYTPNFAVGFCQACKRQIQVALMQRPLHILISRRR